jgi:uncharacterized glyoxalase superfamily protein PhnB
METLTPNIFVADMAKTIDYYKELGFTINMNVPEQAPFIWVNMSCGKVNFMFQSWESLGKDVPAISRKDSSGPLLFYIDIKGIRKFFEKVSSTCEVIVTPHKTFYGATEFSIKDLNGLVLTFAEHEA